MSEKDIQKLIQAGIIDAMTGERIMDFFEKEQKSSGRTILTIFAALGALLLGGGIILILAHNWDSMPETARVIIALLPLLVGQFLAIYTLNSKSDSTEWREATGIILFLAIGATIATLGQIYQLPGDTLSFLRIWIISGIPILYILRSNGTGILILIWIALFMANDKADTGIIFWHWLFILSCLPFYIQTYLRRPKSKMQFTYNWLVAILLIVSYVITYPKADYTVFLMLAILTGTYFHLGRIAFENYKHTSYNSWHHLAQAGTLVLCFIFSFEEFWKFYKTDGMPFHFWIFIALPVLFILYQGILKSSYKEWIMPSSHFWVIALVFHFFDPGSFFLFVFFNLLLLFYGVYYTYNGIRKDALYQTNIGLLTLMILIAIRFFDIDMSFMMRGILFVFMGAGFFAVNYYLIKKGKS